MAQKIVITKAGFNALTETDPKNFIFDSSLNHLKTTQSGSVTLTIGTSSTAQGTVTHSLGYRPLVLAYFNDRADTAKWYNCMTQPEVTNTRRSTLLNVEIVSGTGNVVFNGINRKSSIGTVDIQYEIFYEGE